VRLPSEQEVRYSSSVWRTNLSASNNNHGSLRVSKRSPRGKEHAPRTYEAGRNGPPIGGASALPAPILLTRLFPNLDCEDAQTSAGRSSTSYNDATFDRLISILKGWTS
jgi:hypothetical protein